MISVIIPLYNKESTICRAIMSVINQTMNCWELIIVDDGSTDNSSQLVKSFLYDSRISYYFKNNSGVSCARNEGIKLSKGEWIIFLDADDYFLPDALQILFSNAVKNKTKISVANFYIESKNKRRKYSNFAVEHVSKNNFKECFFRQISPRPGDTLFESSLFKNNIFDEKLSRNEDGEFFFKLMRIYSMAYTPIPIMIYSLDDASMSLSCENIERDFIFILDFKGKRFWEKICLAELLIQGFHIYKDERYRLINKYFKYLFFCVVCSCFVIIRKFLCQKY